MMIGLVYKITSTAGDKVYVGSTKDSLNRRLAKHRGYFSSKRETMPNSKLLFEEYGVDTCSIHLLEAVEFKETQELLWRERHWIENTPNCVNIVRPVISNEEKKEIKRIHREKVKDTEEFKQRSREIQKKYYESHKDQVLEKAKAYNATHKDQKSAYNKVYVEKMSEEKKAERTARMLVWLDCECGTRYQYGNKSRHIKSKTHLDKVNSLSDQMV